MIALRTGRPVMLLALILLSGPRVFADDGDAIAALEKLGAKIERYDDLPGKPVKIVDLSDTDATDASLKLLSSL